MVSGWISGDAAMSLEAWSWATMPLRPLDVHSGVCSASWKIRLLTRRLAVPAAGDIATSYSYSEREGSRTGKKFARSETCLPVVPNPGRSGSSFELTFKEENDWTRAVSDPSVRRASICAGPGEYTLLNEMTLRSMARRAKRARRTQHPRTVRLRDHRHDLHHHVQRSLRRLSLRLRLHLLARRRRVPLVEVLRWGLRMVSESQDEWRTWIATTTRRSALSSATRVPSVRHGNEQRKASTPRRKCAMKDWGREAASKCPRCYSMGLRTLIDRSQRTVSKAVSAMTCRGRPRPSSGHGIPQFTLPFSRHHTP